MGFSMKTLDSENLEIDIEHQCGHHQIFSKKKLFMEKGEKKFPGFAQRTFGWLGDNLCPDCYNEAHPINHI